MVSQNDLEDFIKESAKYANDPSTDKGFLMIKFLDAHIRSGGMPDMGKVKYVVQVAETMADEVISILRKQDEK